MRAKYDNRFIRFLDRKREQLRYKSRSTALLGQILDLCFLAFAFWIPKFESKTESQVRNFEIPMPEILSLYRWRYLAALKYFIEETDFEFLYTVNSSCYVDEKVLIENIKKLEHIGYAGTPVFDKKGSSYFASGANRIISRDVAKKILKKRIFWELTSLEDLALGRMMGKLGIEMQNLPTMNFSEVQEIQEKSFIELSVCHHFRLKSHVLSNNGKVLARNDLVLFKELKERLSNKN